jgi:thiamine biosynthesis lipoprotein
MGLSAHISQLTLDPARRAILLPLGMRIDLGGIAKGWIAEQVALHLARFASSCLVDAGGDMFAVGLPEGETSWTVALEDPFDPSRDLAVLAVTPGAIATSTITRRRWKQGNQLRHHLIDPRSGQPAETEWISVSVTAAHAAQAETLAKALLIGGPRSAHWLLERHPGAYFIAVDRDRNLWGTLESQKALYEQPTKIIQ